jgi:hypothetical protein
MIRNKILALVATFSMTAAIATHTHAATPATVQSTALGMTEMNGPFNNASAKTVTAFVEELAAEYFYSHSAKVESVDVGLFAGPRSMFVNEPRNAFSDSSGSMMLASLGLMALIIRRRMMM